MKNKRLQNVPLPRKHQALEDFNQVIAKCVLQNMYERISDRLALEEDEEEEQKAELKRYREQFARQLAHWKQNPISEVYKERGCTILRGFSGEELFINDLNLKRIGTLRIFYQEVRMKLQLLPKDSLQLRFVGSRRFGCQWCEHVVACADSECTHYLRRTGEAFFKLGFRAKPLKRG